MGMSTSTLAKTAIESCILMKEGLDKIKKEIKDKIEFNTPLLGQSKIQNKDENKDEQK